MGNLGSTFNANEAPEYNDFKPLEPGQYSATVVASEIKATKAGTGEYISFTWEIIDGKGKGRKVFDIVNHRNPNKTAEDIGNATLGRMSRLAGVPNLEDTSQLHGKPMLITLVIDENPGFSPKNVIKAWDPIPSNEGAGEASPPPGGSEKPWQK